MSNTETAENNRSDLHNSTGHRSHLLGGFILIGLGCVFLLNNFGFPIPEKWWTLFIFVPALGSFYRAWYLINLKEDSLELCTNRSSQGLQF